MEKWHLKLIVLLVLVGFLSSCSENASNVVQLPEGMKPDTSAGIEPTPEPTVAPTEIPEDTPGVQVELDENTGLGKITITARKEFRPEVWHDGKCYCRKEMMEVELPKQIDLTLGRSGKGYSYILFDSSVATAHPNKVQCLFKGDSKKNIYDFDFCVRGDLQFSIDEVDQYRDSSENLNLLPIVDKIEMLRGDSILVHIVDGVGVRDNEAKTTSLSTKVEFNCEFWGD